MPWRYKSQNVIVHTKRRSQCCSAHSKIMLKRHNLRGSMSTKVCYYDNACVKSFFHSLNMEEHFISREIMRAAEFDYIKCGYNLRPWQQHIWCGDLTPKQFENKHLALACVHHAPRKALEQLQGLYILDRPAD